MPTKPDVVWSLMELAAIVFVATLVGFAFYGISNIIIKALSHG